MTALADSCYGIGLMVGPAVGGELHQLGGFILPFLVEGSGAFLQSVLVVWGMEKSSDDDEDNNNVVKQKESKVTWAKVVTAPPIYLRKGSGHRLYNFHIQMQLIIQLEFQNMLSVLVFICFLYLFLDILLGIDISLFPYLLMLLSSNSCTLLPFPFICMCFCT